ncbi:TetR/AcrR family transcriptional regulator [Nocardioides sp. WS12]|uniref:TetR/AcrR family transcriptional regulator n=1 Tax=Nocardioides sp. WS12 TaxID=2486272 RepID=UPI0015FBE2A6|nr:TetR/AcrR family transcriptional regulator [Nocardioides sp. WS12]
MGAPRGDATDGRKRRWQEHNAARRQAIIDAALTVLTRDVAPGEELNVQQIADEAGVHRTVLYRYFEDRTDLDLAIQREVCTLATGPLLAAVTLEGTPREIVHRIVGAYVDWAVTNMALMRFAEREVAGAPSKPLDDAITQFAAMVEEVIGAFIEILGVEMSDDDRDSLTPWVFLLVGGGMAAVRSWTARAELRPAVPEFTALLAEVTWLQVEGLAKTRSIELPDLPVEELLNLKDSP